jgi:hypothetical protein
MYIESVHSMEEKAYDDEDGSSGWSKGVFLLILFQGRIQSFGW